TVGSKQRSDVAGLGGDVEAVESADLAEALGDSVRLDDGRGGHRSSFRVAGNPVKDGALVLDTQPQRFDRLRGADSPHLDQLSGPGGPDACRSCSRTHRPVATSVPTT